MLMDNGSLRPEATLSLRNLAGRLSAVLGRPIEPVSLMHSNKVPAEQLDGVPAETFEKAIRARASRGQRRFLVVPLFFGPSRALTKFIPLTVSVLRVEFPQIEVRLAPCLVDTNAYRDNRLATILCDRVLEVIREQGLKRPAVAMIDHGTPVRAVNEVRNHIGSQLYRLLEGYMRVFTVGSMERREEARYDFNEPLLERVFQMEGFTQGDVVLSMMFLNPGRHAGPSGDVAEICANAQKFGKGQLRTHITGLVADHPLLLSILAERYLQARAASPVLSD